METQLKVTCVRGDTHFLTQGKTYTVRDQSDYTYMVWSDCGFDCWFFKDCFEVVTEEGPQGPPECNRQLILDTASKLIHGDRASDYGDAKEMHQRIGDFWSTYLNLETPLTAAQVAMMMVLMKTARSTSSPKFDTYVDLAGYAALAGEMSIQG